MSIFYKRSKLVSFISYLLVFSIFLTMFSPLTALAAESIEKQHLLNEVLATDLSGYEGDREDLLLVNDDNSFLQSQSDIWIDPEYQTDRFIVKYKETDSLVTPQRFNVSTQATSMRVYGGEVFVIETEDPVSLDEMEAQLTGVDYLKLNTFNLTMSWFSFPKKQVNRANLLWTNRLE